jgi:hypothetical protein
VIWGQVCGARVIVEAMLPAMNAELSQGSHFFHNLISFNIGYFSVPPSDSDKIDWKWLAGQGGGDETTFLRHVRTDAPLEIRMDGRSGLGVISFQ